MLREWQKRSIKAVEDEQITFKPKFWENTYYEWLKILNHGVFQGKSYGVIKYQFGLVKMRIQ